jgi:nucleoside-diphosphate-sugar epimerase
VNKKVPFCETDPILQTISPYAMTKMAGEQMCSNYSHLYGIKTVCLRFFTVYGPRQRPDLAISKFTRRIQDGQAIDKYGAGHTARDYTFVSDIVDGILGALNYTDGPICDIFNLGGSQTVTLNDMIATIEKGRGQRGDHQCDAGATRRCTTDLRRCGEGHPHSSIQAHDAHRRRDPPVCGVVQSDARRRHRLLNPSPHTPHRDAMPDSILNQAHELQIDPGHLELLRSR